MAEAGDEIEDQLQSLEESQRGMLNILEDVEDEKNLLANTQKALINILEDYSVENANIQRMNMKLISSNKEIEQFAYIASHDLQEPLRTIVNFSGLLQRKYKGKLDSNADQYLEFINKATGRMQSLIKDLLDYSRAGNDKEKTTIDCNTLLQDIQNDMASSIAEGEVTIYITKLPVIYGLRSGINSLFQNLISNAIKFRKKEVAPVIHITAQNKEREWLFSISDNGIGISELYYNKLFVIFQRLHTKDEYTGTGIGLAQCKKIVDLHGGTIWLTSEPEKGSTFYFTIPKPI